MKLLFRLDECFVVLDCTAATDGDAGKVSRRTGKVAFSECGTRKSAGARSVRPNYMNSAKSGRVQAATTPMIRYGLRHFVMPRVNSVLDVNDAQLQCSLLANENNAFLELCRTTGSTSHH